MSMLGRIKVLLLLPHGEVDGNNILVQEPQNCSLSSVQLSHSVVSTLCSQIISILGFAVQFLLKLLKCITVA